MISATNLVVRHRFGDGGPTIALNAHGDVVPPGEGWTHDPYGAEIADGCMYGRGVAVSKSDFATYAFALLALRGAAGATLGGTVELHFTYDEEAGGEIGPAWLLEQGITQARLRDLAPASPTASSPRTTAACISRSRCAAGRRTPRCPRPGVDALEAATGDPDRALRLRKRAWRDASRRSPASARRSSSSA